MDKEEFLFLIPGVLYGIAIFDLLSLVRNRKTYWESILWAGLLFFAMIGILFNLFEQLSAITSSIYYYTLYLFSPIFFVQSCYLISPNNSNEDMKTVFAENRKGFFLSLSGVVLINLLTNLLISQDINYLRSFGVLVLFLASAFIDKYYVRLLTALTLVLIIVRTYLALG